jgi:hypothetical protein
MAGSSTAQSPAVLTAPAQDEVVLKDIHLPPSPSFWPPALGWWILLALFIGIFGISFSKFYSAYRKKLRKRRQHKNILSKLKSFEKKLKKNPSNQIIAEINILLRQLSVNYYPRSSIANLTGYDWLNFLDKSGQTQGFTKGAGRILIEAPYKSGETENLNLDEFIVLIRKWVKNIIFNQQNVDNTIIASVDINKGVGNG